MRIDEFSNAANIDGSISTTEQTRFFSVGFDLTPSVLETLWIELKSYLSSITLNISGHSLTTIVTSKLSTITKTISKSSKLED